MSDEDKARSIRFLQTVLEDLGKDRPPGVETVGMYVKRLESIEDRLKYVMEILQANG